jgi:hypothetical protein
MDQTPYFFMSTSDAEPGLQALLVVFFPMKTSVRTVLDCSDAFRIAKP